MRQRVVEIAMTSGTARPNACGQAITRTVTIRSMAKPGLRGAEPSRRQASARLRQSRRLSAQTLRDRRAPARASGVLRLFDERMIPASAVLSPTPVTSTRSEPAAFTVPAMTLSPFFFSTGRDSPVSIDSSTLLVPSRINAVRR